MQAYLIFSLLISHTPGWGKSDLFKYAYWLDCYHYHCKPLAQPALATFLPGCISPHPHLQTQTLLRWSRILDPLLCPAILSPEFRRTFQTRLMPLSCFDPLGWNYPTVSSSLDLDSRHKGGTIALCPMKRLNILRKMPARLIKLFSSCGIMFFPWLVS